MPTCDCGKEVEDARGARGHVQFTAGDGHGEKGDVPDDWRELFSGLGEDDDKDDELPSTCRSCGERERKDGSMVCSECSDKDDAQDDDGQESDSEPAGRSDEDGLGSRLKKAVTDDVRHLWGGA